MPFSLIPSDTLFVCTLCYTVFLEKYGGYFYHPGPFYRNNTSVLWSVIMSVFKSVLCRFHDYTIPHNVVKLHTFTYIGHATQYSTYCLEIATAAFVSPVLLH